MEGVVHRVLTVVLASVWLVWNGARRADNRNARVPSSKAGWVAI